LLTFIIDDDDGRLKKKEIKKSKKQFPDIDFKRIDLKQIKFKDENGKEYQFTLKRIRELQEEKLQLIEQEHQQICFHLYIQMIWQDHCVCM
jgi:hypothetical protein